MKLKIACEHPDARFCCVTNAETGELVHGVHRVDVVADINGPLVRAVVHLTDVEVCYSGEAELNRTLLLSVNPADPVSIEHAIRHLKALKAGV